MCTVIYMSFPFQDCKKWSQIRVTDCASGVDSTVKESTYETLMNFFVLCLLPIVTQF